MGMPATRQCPPIRVRLEPTKPIRVAADSLRGNSKNRAENTTWRVYTPQNGGSRDRDERPLSGEFVERAPRARRKTPLPLKHPGEEHDGAIRSGRTDP